MEFTCNTASYIVLWMAMYVQLPSMQNETVLDGLIQSLQKLQKSVFKRGFICKGHLSHYEHFSPT